ncbi:MAG: glutamate--tRNA ligase [Chloroflexi bacterium]|nr:glutamate--tRNA ligase [Chloroflexota bacterium]
MVQLTPARVRYAPSPTGLPHVGNIRTALFNWLWARHTGGQFILRIEDTDVARRVEGATEGIMESLRWLGLDWDEGPLVGGPYAPYVQSERLPRYEQEAARLVGSGRAYFCFCSEERLEAMRAAQARRREPPRYDGTCRRLPDEERKRRKDGGEPCVVRFKVPHRGETVTFHDLVRGEISFRDEDIEDFVILKSDGYPTYHLANVVDDHLMSITHVIRGEEWISSCPKHVLLYHAFGWQREMPVFVHMPVTLGPDKGKLSKRHGAEPVLEYRRQGYLPEALVNFMALLGWSLDDKTEIIGREDLVKHFSLERIGATSAAFNREKLDWMNGVYIRQLSPEELTDKLMPFLEEWQARTRAPHFSRSLLRQVVPLIQERLRRLDEAPALADFFFVDELAYDAVLLAPRGLPPDAARDALGRTREAVSALREWTPEALEGGIRGLALELGLKTGPYFGCIRVAVTGRAVSPPLFQTMAVIGRGRCLARLDAAIEKLKQGAA